MHVTIFYIYLRLYFDNVFRKTNLCLLQEKYTLNVNVYV